jgi:DNA (cytosine-5)-methyltransferase 1
MGYHRAGFEVVGVDIRPQPNYPFEFIQADAMQFLDDWPVWVAELFDAIHASPPCQRYMTGGMVNRWKRPDLLGPIRDRLKASGVPWVIENVPGAPMRADILLCGSMFGLEVRRHRLFELSWEPTVLTSPCSHGRPVAGVYGNAHGKAGAWPGMLPSDLPTWSRAMGIDWMTAKEITEAIPPAYSEFIGQELMGILATTEQELTA